MTQTSKAPRNRTIQLTETEVHTYCRRLLTLDGPATLPQVTNRTIYGQMEHTVPWLRNEAFDLLILDPPYNLPKVFGAKRFSQMSTSAYADWIDSWLTPLLPKLKRSASVYFCGDWRSSSAIQLVAERYFKVRNRITWEREKGRGALANWKNSSEDIWFCTMGDTYTFNGDSVRVRRKVLAPYTNADGTPKDWVNGPAGGFRDTCPSNLWTDLTVPFWSMPENTDHPTQKPEKLMAKLILASSNAGDVILDPFLGSGTTSVVAKKLARRFVGIESDLRFACLAEKRIQLAESVQSIQGYEQGVFWERNSQPPTSPATASRNPRLLL